MLYPSLDPNERFRDRRESTRRRKRRRRAVVAGILLLAVLALAGGMTLAGKGGKAGADAGTQAASHAPTALQVAARPRPLPVEVRGVHVTAALASIPGKLAEYEALTKYGLNTIELDVKDEGGEIGFNPSGVALARKTGAVRDYYDPHKVAREMHRKGIYLIGRVVVFQDPYLARARPDMAIRRPDGSIWATSAGLEWVNPYDRRVWDYAVSVAAAAARAGFDEIMLDYVRFPSDGDVGAAVYPGRTSVPKGRLVANFAAYAQQRLAPLGVRVSTALFGLSATRDMGIGQRRARRDGVPHADRLQARDSRQRRAARAVGPGLELQARAGNAADPRGAAPGGQGLPPLERLRDLHEERARTAVLTSGAVAGLGYAGSDGCHAHDRAPHRDSRASLPGDRGARETRDRASLARPPRDLCRASRERDDHRRRRQRLRRLRRGRRRRERRTRPSAHRRGGRRAGGPLPPHRFHRRPLRAGGIAGRAPLRPRSDLRRNACGLLQRRHGGGRERRQARPPAHRAGGRDRLR